MTEHLWPDERIQRRYDELNAIAPGYPDLNMRDVAREIRNDLQQRIDALEAENAKLRDDYAGLQSWCKIVEEGLYADIKQQKEDMAEIERLRAILSDEDVIEAIRTIFRNLAERDANDEWLPERDAIHVWLQNLESETGS